MIRRSATAGAIALAAACLAACTASAGPSAGPASTVAPTVTNPVGGPVPTGPVDVGPISSAAGTCTLLTRQSVANDVGMRLARVSVQSRGGRQVGCRFYALQNSPLAASEHLPGPKQPAVRLQLSRYADSTAAHNAMVRLAEAGTNAQQVDVGGQVGLAYQTAFYSKDHGKDWACAFNRGRTLAVIETVTTDTSFNAVALAGHLVAKLG